MVSLYPSKSNNVPYLKNSAVKWFHMRCAYSHRQSLGGGRGGHCPPRSEPIDFVRSMNTKIFSHCLILFALSYFNEYVKA